MNERPPEATSASEWARIARRRRILVWSGAGLAVVAVVVAIVALLLAARGDDSGPATFEPVSRGNEPSSAVGAPETTPTAEPTTSPGASSAATTTASASTTPTPDTCLIAYRRAGSLYVARPDGSDERRVAASASGVFSIAPDGRTLALVDAGTGILALHDIATGTRIAIGAANQEAPAWPTASAWLVYAIGSGESARVWRVERDGKNAKALFSGQEAAVSSDGSVVSGIQHAASGASSIVVYREGHASVFPVAGYAADVACTGERVFFSLAGDDGAESSIRLMYFNGSGSPVRVGPQAGARVSFQDLCLTLDGKRLAYTETGDDGYSRLFVIDADGGGERSLSVRRDDYPLRWGCDGRLYFIEGNAIQGEPTKLMAVSADGTGRVVVVEGAAR